VKVAIVNDSIMVVETLRRILLASKQHEVVWTASNGAEAVERSRSSCPDIILMDIEMPVMDGVEATRQIMAENACAILIVTGTVEHRTTQVFQCLGAGALDVVKLSNLFDAPNSEEPALLSKLKTLSYILNKKLGPVTDYNSEVTICKKLVVVGASAGGPAAIATLLSSLPTDFPAGIIIVQHIDTQFVPSLVSWLGEHSNLHVRLACEGDQLEPGKVLVAGGDRHLRFLSAQRLGYTIEPRDSPYRPSIDVLFESASRFWKDDIVGVLLTGMGRDGARGLQLLSHSKAITIAQSAATSAVYGMPKAAASLGAAKEILDLVDIAPRIEALLGASKGNLSK
jgi:two-component system response regulator WspF